MKCPNCKNEFEISHVANNFGQKFEIAKCPNCHGFWFKKFQLYAFPKEEASKIDSSSGGSQLLNKLTCPEDNQPLTDFKDPNVPPEFKGFRCPTCGGMFVPQGQLSYYKEYQSQNQPYFDTSKKSATVLSALIVLLFLDIVFLARSNIRLSADMTTAQANGSQFWNNQNMIALSLAIILILIIIILSVKGLAKKKKKP